MRVCAYGWQPQGTLRELIETSGVDGFLMGPIHPQGIHRAQFVQLIARMQTLKRMAPPAGGLLGGSMMGSAAAGAGFMPPAAAPPMPGTTTASMAGGQPLGGSMYAAAAPPQPAAGPQQQPRMSSVGQPNPLYNLPPSPMPSQPGGAPGAVPSQQGGQPAAGNADGEAQMMQQLMAEINQLRSELNQN